MKIELVSSNLPGSSTTYSTTVEGTVQKSDASEVTLKDCRIESRNDHQVPILAEIPPLKRHFSSTGVGSEERQEFSVPANQIASVQKIQR